MFHHAIVYMGDLHLVHPALNLSILDFLDAGILIMMQQVSLMIEHGGLLHVLPLAVHLKFFLLDKYRGLF